MPLTRYDISIHPETQWEAAWYSSEACSMGEWVRSDDVETLETSLENIRQELRKLAILAGYNPSEGIHCLDCVVLLDTFLRKHNK